MALVAKTNQTRSTITLVVLVAVLLGGALFLFRDRLFPAPAPTGTGTEGPTVQTLPVFPTSGLETLNTNAAQSLTPHGAATVTPCPGRDNPFDSSGRPEGCT